MLRAELVAMQGELDIASDRITALEDTVSSLNDAVVQLQGEIQLLQRPARSSGESSHDSSASTEGDREQFTMVAQAE